MLRIFVLVLAAANLLYFGWAHWAAEKQPVLTAVASAGKPGRNKAGTQQPAPPCATLGPFHDDVLANQAEQQLIKSGWNPARRTTSEDIQDGWWVYVVNANTAAQTRTLDAIRRSGLRDAFAMTDDAEFRVSVGLFSDQKRAEERARRVRSLKLDAVVKERRKDQPVIWFDLPGMAREALGDGRLNSTGLPLDALRIEACPVPADEVPPAGPTEPAPTTAPEDGTAANQNSVTTVTSDQAGQIARV